MGAPNLGVSLIDLLQDILVIASFLGVLYAPFHYLDKYASAQAKAKARIAIRAGQSNTDTKPLVSLLESFFGPKHFTIRCFARSAVMSFVFTFLFLGMVDRYVLDLAAYVGRYDARINPAEEKLREAMRILIPVQEELIEKLKDSKDPEVRAEVEKLKLGRERAQELIDEGMSHGTYVLVWMILSVTILLNIVCDYFALGKTRIILKRISATQSSLAISGYLVVDLIFAVLLWFLLTLLFIYLNLHAFSAWLKETPDLVSVTAIVSLATTIATSIWIYTFLAGTFLSIYLRRTVNLLLRGTTWLVDPEEHTFKVIGIVGSVAITVLLAVSFLIIAWAR